jgi:hypothetical protein
VGGGVRGDWGGRVGGRREGNARVGREGLGHRFAAAWVRVRAARRLVTDKVVVCSARRF